METSENKGENEDENEGENERENYDNNDMKNKDCNQKFILKKRKEKFTGLKAKILKIYRSKQKVSINSKPLTNKKDIKYINENNDNDIDNENNKIIKEKLIDDYNINEYNSESE